MHRSAKKKYIYIYIHIAFELTSIKPLGHKQVYTIYTDISKICIYEFLFRYQNTNISMYMRLSSCVILCFRLYRLTCTYNVHITSWVREHYRSRPGTLEYIKSRIMWYSIYSWCQSLHYLSLVYHVAKVGTQNLCWVICAVHQHILCMLQQGASQVFYICHITAREMRDTLHTRCNQCVTMPSEIQF